MNNDSVIQRIFTTLKELKWRDCEQNPDYEWYYAEDMHYIIRQKQTNACWFVKAKSPLTAFEYVINKMKGAI